MGRLEARIARLAPVAAAAVAGRAQLRAHAFANWLDTLALAWRDASALVARLRRGGTAEAEARSDARAWLETARWFGAICYEEGAAVLHGTLRQTPLTETGESFTDAEATAVVDWCASVWGVGSDHPHAPWLPPTQRLGALDEEPPRPALIAATAARARHHPQPFDLAARPARPARWPASQADGFAHLAYLFVYFGEGEQAIAAVAEWLRVQAGLGDAAAAEQAANLAADVATLRTLVAEAGEAAACADVTAWGMSRAEAALLLEYAGARIRHAGGATSATP